MKFDRIISRAMPLPWQAGEKVPWDDPAFSDRMLEQHLAQTHDWASRRMSVIEHQLEFIKDLLTRHGGKRILDLGCGPGLYTQLLAQAGYDCTGVDFSPASIRYAREAAEKASLSIDYVLADVREYIPAEGFDLVMMLFGEFNVFKEADAGRLLAQAFAALSEDGILLMEVQTFEAVHAGGRQPHGWEALENGIFCDAPHLYLEEHAWDPASTTATTRYTIIDAATADVTEYGASVKAYTESGYHSLLQSTGFAKIEAVKPDMWPVGDIFSDKLQTYCAFRKGA